MRAALTRLLLACAPLPLAACPTSPGRFDPPTLAWRAVPTTEEAGVAFSPVVVEVHGGDDGTVVTLSLVSNITTIETTVATSRNGVAVFDDVRHGVAETVQLRAAVPGPSPEVCASVFVAAGPATGLPISIASLSDLGGQANQASDTSWSVDGPPSISGDGRFVAFHSVATNLVAGGTSGSRIVFARDMVLGQTRMASGSPSGGAATTPCNAPSISANGRFVAFICDPYAPSVFIKDQQMLVVEQVDHGYSLALSGNGRHLAYISLGQVRLYDRLTRARSFADVSSTGVSGNGTTNRYVPAPALSRDGRFVAFASVASNLVPGDTNGVFDFFVHDRDVDGNGVFDEPGGMATERVSIAPDGTQMLNDWPDTVAISDDGRYVTFGNGSIYQRDRVAGVTTLVAFGRGPLASADGRFVVYASDQIYVWDRTSRSSALVSADATGVPGDSPVNQYTGPSISADGRYVAFMSAATNLVPGDTNGLADVFVAPNPLYP
jgi:hypothetical protein